MTRDPNPQIRSERGSDYPLQPYFAWMNTVHAYTSSTDTESNIPHVSNPHIDRLNHIFFANFVAYEYIRRRALRTRIEFKIVSLAWGMPLTVD